MALNKEGEVMGNLDFETDLFSPGHIGCTAGVRDAITKAVTQGKYTLGEEEETEIIRATTQTIVARHCAGDWGDLDEEDKEQNNKALGADPEKRGRLFSKYTMMIHGADTDVKNFSLVFTHTPKDVYVITEADRFVTTILFPDEY